jgi:hypothetical protein
MENETNGPNLEDLMSMGIQTAKQGNKESARVIFQRILTADAENERAWLWMAAVAESLPERIRYLNTVLRLNPNNPTALRELRQIKEQRESSNTLVIRYGAIGLGVALVLLVLIAVLIVAL